MKRHINCLLAAVLFSVSFFYSFPACAGLGDVKQIGFQHISLPDNISNDEFAVKAIYFAVKEEAKRLKKVKINYDGKAAAADDAYVRGDIREYRLHWQWNKPSVGTKKECVWTKERNWYDSKGKKHEMTIRRYEEKPEGNVGHYSFTAGVGATLYLIDAKTGEILVFYSKYATNDKEIDAFNEIVEDFYKKVKKEISRAKDD